jgi:hypothetical protein
MVFNFVTHLGPTEKVQKVGSSDFVVHKKQTLYR